MSNCYRSVIAKSEKEQYPIDVEAHVVKFRDYLLFGHKKEGLEYAMQNGLWGHALFLASKMDERSYSNVMLRFANGLVSKYVLIKFQSVAVRLKLMWKDLEQRTKYITGLITLLGCK